MATTSPVQDAADLITRARAAGIELWCEGPRLRFRAPPDALTPEMRELMRSRRSAIVAWLQEEASQRVERSPLAANQRGLWFLHRLAASSSAYNVGFTARIHGEVNVAALQDTLQVLVDRHESLRSVYPFNDGEPQRLARGRVALELECVPAHGWTAAQLRTAIQAAYARPFDLENGPVLRAALFEEAEDRRVFLLVVHHIAIDGTALFALLEELFAVYSAFKHETAVPGSPETTATLSEFVAWQEKMLGQADTDRAFWAGVLQPPPPRLALPADRPRAAISAMRGSSISVPLPAALTQKLREVSVAHRTTEFVFLLSVWYVLLHRLTGQDDITVGTPALGRPAQRFARTVGDLVNPLPLRLRSLQDLTFAELLQKVRAVVLEGMQHQDYPLPRMMEERGSRAEPGGAPFQTLFMVQDFGRFHQFKRLLQAPEEERIEFGALTLGHYALQQQEGQFELSVDVWPRGDEFLCAWKFDTDLFDQATVERLARHYATLAEHAVAAPHLPVSQLALLNQADRDFLVRELNRTAMAYPPGATLQDLIAAQVERTPDAVAVTFENEHVTYRELDTRANHLALVLQERGVGADSLVGICVERSVAMVVGLLGILKAGGAYVPMDPSYPRDRLAFMLADADVKVLLTQQHLVPLLPPHGAENLTLDADLPRHSGTALDRAPSRAREDNLAYMIYTSGSTGRPKGALNEHRGIVNRLRWMQDTYQLTSRDAVLQKTPFSFDVSVWEFFWPLLTGARLVMARPGGHQDPAYLVDLISREQITVVHFVPSMLRIFLEAPGLDRCGSLRDVMCSGEALPADVVKMFHARLPARLHNLYGPTEAAVDVTYWPCPRDNDLTVVPIGRPVANTQCYILDAQGQPVPLGVPGELHLGGVQVGRGYHQRPELTAEKFIPDPFRAAPDARLYKTGDLCRYRTDGTIEYLGRIDHQVKIRGFRIELGEIEAALQKHPAVKDVVVVARELAAGDQRLVAYWTAHAGGTPGVDELKEAIGGMLPDYMVPSFFVRLEQLPLSPNGKIDRKALPAPVAADLADTRVYTAPETPTQESVARIFAEILNAPKVGIHHNFFELGGHSLLAARMISRVRERLTFELPLRAVFESPTVCGIAEYIDNVRWTQQPVATAGAAEQERVDIEL